MALNIVQIEENWFWDGQGVEERSKVIKALIDDGKIHRVLVDKVKGWQKYFPKHPSLVLYQLRCSSLSLIQELQDRLLPVTVSNDLETHANDLETPDTNVTARGRGYHSFPETLKNICERFLQTPVVENDQKYFWSGEVRHSYRQLVRDLASLGIVRLLPVRDVPNWQSHWPQLLNKKPSQKLPPAVVMVDEKTLTEWASNPPESLGTGRQWTVFVATGQKIQSNELSAPVTFATVKQAAQAVIKSAETTNSSETFISDVISYLREHLKNKSKIARP